MCDKEQFLAYIDESGDLGRSLKSTPWFFISACVVHSSEAPLVSKYIDEAKHKLWFSHHQTPPDIIHWRSLKHPYKQALVPIFTSKSYTQIVVAFWTSKLSKVKKQGLANANTGYRYACRLLIERISWYIRDSHGQVRLTFDKTDRLDLPALKQYLTYIMSQPSCKIADVINGIRVSSAKETKLLSLADNATSSFASAFNPDRLGNTFPHYANPSISHLYRRGRLWRYGLKIMPSETTQREFTAKYPFTNEWF